MSKPGWRVANWVWWLTVQAVLLCDRLFSWSRITSKNWFTWINQAYLKHHKGPLSKLPRTDCVQYSSRLVQVLGLSSSLTNPYNQSARLNTSWQEHQSVQLIPFDISCSYCVVKIWPHIFHSKLSAVLYIKYVLLTMIVNTRRADGLSETTGTVFSPYRACYIPN